MRLGGGYWNRGARRTRAGCGRLRTWEPARGSGTESREQGEQERGEIQPFDPTVALRSLPPVGPALCSLTTSLCAQPEAAPLGSFPACELCADGLFCVDAGNPNFGFSSFDNLAAGCLLVFQVITLHNMDYLPTRGPHHLGSR